MSIDVDRIKINKDTTAELDIGGVPGQPRVGFWLNVPEANQDDNNAVIWLTNTEGRVTGVDKVALRVLNGPSVIITPDCIELNGSVKMPIEGEAGLATLTVKRVDGELVLDISE